VIRPAGFVGCATPLPVSVDGHDAYGLACGEHVVLTVPRLATGSVFNCIQAAAVFPS
jgi:hypothetical protein